MRWLTIVSIIAVVGCGAPSDKQVITPTTPAPTNAAKLTDSTDERDDWDLQIEEVRSRYNQQINSLIDRRDPLYDEIQALEAARGTAPAEKYQAMSSIIRGINDLIERRDSEVTEINKNKRAHLIEKQPVSKEFLKAQRVEIERLKQKE